MKKSVKVLLGCFSAIIISLISICAATADDSKNVEILFTSDLHSYVENYDVVIDGQVKNIGGFPRIKTYIDSIKNKNKDVLLLDCGDIVMGTLSQALVDTDAVELRTMSEMGYEVLTYGNHEFDYGAKALADMYVNVANDGTEHPKFVICNVDWNAGDEYTNTLKAGMEKYGYSDYVIIEKNGVKIAITGVLGKEAIDVAPTCELTFIDPVEAVKKTVSDIKKNENPDMIVCVSHSGTNSNPKKSEDEILAKEVPDLDVIISGHSHTVLKECITVGNTCIGSCGAYGQYVGHINLQEKPNGRWETKGYELVLMDESIKEDEALKQTLVERLSNLNEGTLEAYGYKYDDVLAYNDGYIFEEVDDLYFIHDEARLGNIISDAYRYIANSTPTGQEIKFDASVAPAGTIRGTIIPGNITVAKAFEMLSLGKGPDGNIGYPLVSLFLTGKEIKTMAEVDGTVSDLMESARLYTSGVCLSYNPKRMILNKVNDVWINEPIMNKSRTEIDDDKLYRIVTDYYSMSMLGAVTDLSKGILSIVPKDANGNPIENYDNAIIYDKEGRELKAWVALAEYLKSFPEEGNGYSTVPEYYSEKQGRKVRDNSLNPVSLFKNTNIFFYAIVLIVVVVIAIIVIVVRLSKKKKNRKKVFIE